MARHEKTKYMTWENGNKPFVSLSGWRLWNAINDREGKHASGIVCVYLHVQKQGEVQGQQGAAYRRDRPFRLSVCVADLSSETSVRRAKCPGWLGLGLSATHGSDSFHMFSHLPQRAKMFSQCAVKLIILHFRLHIAASEWALISIQPLPCQIWLPRLLPACRLFYLSDSEVSNQPFKRQ